MNIPRPLAVFDCNVLFQALARPTGASAAALRLAEQSRITLFISKRVLRELRLTLQYPHIRKRYPELTQAVIKEYCDRILFRGVLVRSVPPFFELPRDPDDQPYIDLAAVANADFLVTRDKDLLSLMTDHALVAKQFRQCLPRLRVVEPPEFLAAVSPQN